MSSTLCTVYLNLFASSKVLLLVTGDGLNIFILVSAVACLFSWRSQIRSNVTVIILGSTGGNLVNLSMWQWPFTGGIRATGCWAFAYAKYWWAPKFWQASLLSSMSSHYFLYLPDSGAQLQTSGKQHHFPASAILFPRLTIGLKKLILWLQGGRVDHLDLASLTCFFFIEH